MSDEYTYLPVIIPLVGSAMHRAAESEEERNLALQENALLKELTSATDPAVKKNIQERLVNHQCTMYAKGGAFTPKDDASKEERDVYQFCAIRDEFQSRAFMKNCSLLSKPDAIAQCEQKAERQGDAAAASTILFGGTMLGMMDIFLLSMAVNAGASLSAMAVPMILLGGIGGFVSHGVDRAVNAGTGTPLHEHLANGLFSIFEKLAPQVNERAAELPSIPLLGYLYY